MKSELCFLCDSSVVCNRAARWSEFRCTLSGGSGKTFYTVLGILALLAVFMVIGCIWWVNSSSRTSVPDDDQLMVEMNAAEAEEKERAEKEARDKAERKKWEEEAAAKKKDQKEAEDAVKRQKAEVNRKTRTAEEARKEVEAAIRKAQEDEGRKDSYLGLDKVKKGNDL